MILRRVLTAISLFALTAAAQAQDVTTVYVGGGNATNPSTFLDENNQLTGYDIEVLKAADELLEQYQFEFQPFEFTGLFAALDSGRIDIAASSLQANPQRAEKYDFSTGYINSNSYITFLASRTDITSVEDLSGKTVEAWAKGSADFLYFTDFNVSHPDKPVGIITAAGDPAIIIKNLVGGRTDAYVANDQTRSRMSKQFGVELAFLPEPTKVGSNIFILRKGQDDLKAALDSALRELAANGTLGSLSEKWFGADFTVGATN
ncbi:transporter substrate-binding domain-containing protein [Mesorhizobium sp. DCY119]|uniref:transporter substrate-binding domain-containing protein n=1 Tax=Mesorhizobium sp. DCY119 TaxID=2108445 RepID=UPI0014039757|nr:transporter substrate-binding domain-containing protein [Mesorhizobium sp. DCY119]